jgi:HEAT repeat protein
MRAWLLLVALVTAAPTDDVKDLVRDLGASSTPTRNRARDTLAARRDPSVIAPIVAALPRFGFTSRTAAQKVLEAMPWPHIQKRMRALLRSPDLELRALAAASLFRKGDEAGVPAAARALREGRHEGPDYWPVLIRAYSIRHEDISAAIRSRLPKLQGHALRYALIHVFLAEDRLAISLVESLTTSKDRAVRLPACALLYQMGRRDVIPALATNLADAAGTELALRDALRFLAPVPRPPKAVLGALVTRLAGDDRAAIQVAVLGQLADWACLQALPLALERLDHDDGKVARAAFGLIVRLTGRDRQEALETALSHRDGTIRVLAAEALRRLDIHAGLPVVLEVLRSRNVVDRREAARVLGTFPLRRVIPSLIDAFMDRDRLVREAASKGLCRVVTTLFPHLRLDWSILDPRAPAEARKKAVEVLRAWWKARSR